MSTCVWSPNCFVFSCWKTHWMWQWSESWPTSTLAGILFSFCQQSERSPNLEQWYEERESGRYRKLRECETGLLIRKHHWEMFVKHYTYVLKHYTINKDDFPLVRATWFLIPCPSFLHWYPQGAWQDGCHCGPPANSPEWRGPSTQICEASPHPTWWWESQTSWHQWVRKPEARAEDSSDTRSLGNNCR